MNQVNSTVTQPDSRVNAHPAPAEPSNNSFANSQYKVRKLLQSFHSLKKFNNLTVFSQSIDMIQSRADASAPKPESASQNFRIRDPRLMRQMQSQNPPQRNFNQRNRAGPAPPAMQHFGHPSASFASNNQMDDPSRRSAMFNEMPDDSSRKSRTASKGRGSAKDVKSRLNSKTSPKSQKLSSSQKSPKSSSSSSTSSASKSSSKSSKTSSTSPSSRTSPKDLKKDRYKEKEAAKVPLGRSSAALAEAEKKIKEFTIPKKRSPSPKDKSTKSITDSKVSSTTKTVDSPNKLKGNSKLNSKSSRVNVKPHRDGSPPVSAKENVETVPHQQPDKRQKTPPAVSTITTNATTATATVAAAATITTTSTATTIESSSNDVATINASSSTGGSGSGDHPFAGTGDNQDFKSKDNNFVVRLVKISHIVHNSLLTRLTMMMMMILSNGLIVDCINRRADILNKLFVIGTGDNFFIKTFCGFFFLILKFFETIFFV